MIEEDFLECFSRIADHTDGTADAKQLAAYLNLPTDHPSVLGLFHLYDSVIRCYRASLLSSSSNISLAQDRTGVITFKKYVRGRCALDRQAANNKRPDVTWARVKSLLKLTPTELEKIDAFLAQSVKPDANENGIWFALKLMD